MALFDAAVAAADPDGPPKMTPLMTKAPRAAGDWQVVQVPGGWLRFSEKASRVDAHCGRHHGCKMDRALSKCPIGLHLAWLAADADDKAAHDLLKPAMSYDARMAGRNAFAALADHHGGLYRTILEEEARVRGTREEPK